MSFSRISAVTAFTIFVAMLTGCQDQSAKPTLSKTTLENLQTAYNGESNASAKYAAFAKKADEEGHAEAASLFRAASRAEQVHAGNHAKVITAMGGQPTADVKAPEVKSTAENVKAAIAGETYERDVMYPVFLELAKSEKNAQAIQTFEFALAAETEHAKLYTAALAVVQKGKASGKTWYVCPKCGMTVAAIDGKCPECGTAAEKFEAIK